MLWIWTWKNGRVVVVEIGKSCSCRDWTTVKFVVGNVNIRLYYLCADGRSQREVAISICKYELLQVSPMW